MLMGVGDIPMSYFDSRALKLDRVAFGPKMTGSSGCEEPHASGHATCCWGATTEQLEAARPSPVRIATTVLLCIALSALLCHREALPAAATRARTRPASATLTAYSLAYNGALMCTSAVLVTMRDGTVTRALPWISRACQ